MMSEIQHLLDFPRVTAALRSVPLPEHEYDVAAKMLTFAIDRFLIKDLAEWDTCATELRFEMGLGTQAEIHGIMDLVLFKDDLVQIVDWKTANSLDMPNYATMQSETWQTYGYLGPGLDWLNKHYGVRGVTKMQYRAFDEDGLRVIDVLQHHDAGTYREITRQQAESANAMFVQLSHQFSAGPWPKTLPWTCHKGGKNGPTCPYWDDCINGRVPEAKQSPKPPMSKSGWSSFLECPEKYRREGDVEARGEGTIAQRRGLSFTNAIAEIYEQSFSLKNGTVWPREASQEQKEN